MTGFDVDPDSLLRASTAMQTSADQLDQALDGFVNSLSSIVEPWGADLLGQLIGGGYAAIEDLAIKTYSSIVDGLDSFAEGIEDMATTYGGTEESTTSNIRSAGE
ncbi:MAG TPA: hypothetical protein VGL21_04480 [Jatrophihabitantaceae bacterium]|jgi:hypothetical protein